MNNDPNNMNGQVPNPGSQNVVVTPTPSTISQTAQASVTQAATPTAPVVPSEVQTATNVAQPVTENTTQPTQQRVQLVNDQTALKAISPVDMQQKTEEGTDNANESGNDTNKANAPTENNGGGGSKIQTFFLILLFVGLLAFIVNIDKITVYIKSHRENSQQVVENITTGTLSCESEKSSSAMDFTYIAKFEFRDSKLKRLNYSTEIRGDANLDEEQLTKLNEECLAVKEQAGNLSGIDITCSLENGLLKEKQVFTYDSINREEAMSAFIEAGGMYPEYRRDQNIDDIEREMNAAAYTCKRIK